MSKEENKLKLRNKLREKIEEKKISRQDKNTKQKIFDETLAKTGIDKEELNKNIKILRKAGLNNKINTNTTPNANDITKLLSKLGIDEQKMMEIFLQNKK